MAIIDSLCALLSRLPGLILPALAFILALFLCGVVFRLLLGRNSGLNHALSSALGIVLVYAASVVIYTYRPGNLSALLSPLPFVTFSGDTLVLVELSGLALPQLCRQVLSMIVLAFLANLLDDIFPRGRHLPGWLFYRTLTVLLAMVVHYLAHVLIQLLIPGLMEGYGPMIALSILLFMLLLGSLKLLLGLVLAAVNPVVGALYGFFFGHSTGKKLSRAVLTTFVLCLFVYTLRHLGFGVIPISPAALPGYWPLVLAVMLLWYVIGCVL